MISNQIVSPREKEVLHLIAYEYTTKEIASKLYISTHTADSHRKNLMQKLRVRNVAGMVRVAFEKGILQTAHVFIVLLFFSTANIYGSHTIWTGGASDHDWFNAANWNNGVPTPMDSATIAMDSVIINAISSVEHLALMDGARLVITSAGMLSFHNSITALKSTDASIYNYGIIDIQAPMGEGIVLIGNSVFNNFTAARLLVFGSDSTSIFNDTSAALRNQAGGLVWIQNCKRPVVNNGMVDNRGTFNVNFSARAAIVSKGSIDNRGLMSIDSSMTDAGLVIELGGEFVNRDTLLIHRIDREGIVVKGDFNNRANAFVDIFGSKFTDGVEVQPNGRWNNLGKISISDIDNNAIDNNGTFVNSDSIIIAQSGTGIELSDTLINESGGVIYIHDLNSARGIDISNNGILINEGEIKMKNGLSDGIGGSSNSKLENYGSISIAQLTDRGISYIDTILNAAGATIMIVNAAEQGILHQNGLISNLGKIEIDSMGLEGIGISGGRIMNYDTMLISNVGTDGVYLEGGQFNNQMGAYCHISNVTRDGINLDDDNVKVTNAGEFIVKATDHSGVDLDLGKFENSGTLDISDVELIGINVRDSLINKVPGTIEIWDVNDSSEAGILNESNGSIVNDGKIDIHNMPSDGLENNGSVINNGTLLINNIGVRALENNTRLTNNGVIDVHSVTFGIIHSGFDTLTNNGYLQIGNASFYGLFVNAHFDNMDSIVIESACPGIENSDTLHNHTTGVILISKEGNNPCVINTEYITNDGEISCLVQSASGRPESAQDNAAIDAVSGSFWINTGNSKLLIDASNGIRPAISIENGAEFIMLGDLAAYPSDGG